MPKLEELNGLSREEFTRILAPAFEHSPWVAARTAAQRPFQSVTDLHTALCQTVKKARDDEKLALIRAHPDLAGNANLTSESQSEQARAGLDRALIGEVEQFRENSRQYRERFGFPFVICAREHNKEAVQRAFAARLQNSREQEIETALQEIYKIANLRVRDLTQ
jgi:2-oxo-4-hydroxy-4-carboxy-5-ureidoimidazoline decarboxylase